MTTSPCNEAGILYVWRNGKAGDVLQAVARDLGLAYHEFEDLKDIPKYIQRPYPTVLLVDVHHPLSYELVNFVHQHMPHLPLLLLVPSDANGELSWINSVAAWDVICWPCDFAEIRFRVERAVRYASSLRLPAEGTPFAQEAVLLDTVEALFTLFCIGDAVAAAHSVRTAAYAAMLTKAVLEEEHRVKWVRLAALLHDIGKVGVAREVLYKEGGLSPEEFEQIKSHAWLGTLPLERHQLLRPFVRVVRHVHEHFNGLGYPDGLRGAQIPLESRIIAVADTFDALTTDRPYRSALPLDEAFRVLRLEAGQRLDPLLVDVFTTLWHQEGLQLIPPDAVQFPLPPGRSVLELLVSLERLLDAGRDGHTVHSGGKTGVLTEEKTQTSEKATAANDGATLRREARQ